MHVMMETVGLQEVKQPGALERASYIQTLARRIKIGSAVLLAAGGIYLGIKDGAISSQTAGNYQNISDCNPSMDGDTTPVPIEGSQINSVQASGVGVCQFKGYDYALHEFNPR